MPSRIYYSDEAEQLARKQQVLQITLFMLIGLSIGAVVALLFAPQKGKQTRKDISKELGDTFGSGRDSTSDVVKETIKRLEDQYKSLRSEMDKLVSSVRN